jgi:N-glycosylase/DNA lyase
MVETRSKLQPLRMTEVGSPSPKRVEGKTSTPTKRIRSPKTPSPSARKKAKPSPKAVSPASPDLVVLRSSQVSSVAPDEKYLDLHILPCELRPSATLTTGQCFHWRVVERDDTVLESPGSAWGSHDATEWIGILRFGQDQSFVVSLKETPATTLYRILYAPQDIDVRKELYHYFQLGEPLAPLYQKWAEADPKRLARIAKCLPGVRIIEQDPWECLVSFICSSNNNIPRITKMLSAVRQRYGDALFTIENETFYSFPSLETLRRCATNADLREIGMGYRAKYLMETMETLHSLGGEKYLHDLRSIQDPVVVQEKLTQFCGVGRKVADCVALFSLRQGGTIPVDVHVWNIARRDYDADGVLVDVKSLTPSVYRQVGDLFRSRFPEQAGWAHSLLFVAELPSFRPVLPEDIVIEMNKFRQLEQGKKEAARDAKREKKKAVH